MSNIPANVSAVRSLAAEAARRAGRDPAAVTVIAVTKTRSVAEIEQVMAAGLSHLGENRVQEARNKWQTIAALRPSPAPTWHLIGSLQTNKVRAALEFADLIHSLDRFSLAEALQRGAAILERSVPCLVQVNVSGESSKHGLGPAELVPFLRQVAALPALQVQGLMTMAPATADPEAARPVFRRLRELAAEAAALGLPGVQMTHLSMGMSGDYTVAVEEGATLIRVGTALFGERSN